MADVKILSSEIANRIAAGEVVERPASVLKELVDNAVDAGASRIVVRTEKAGTSLIEVSDNGSGMNRSNALLCLEQHATSKISDANDLDAITSYGFRGEAIPSIASVSRFTILTRLHDELEGTMVQVNGGNVSTVEQIGCAPGTCMRVAKLFYNVPARKKFLKSQRTEDFHLQEIFIQMALSRPDIHMELHCDGRTIYNIPPSTDLRTRLRPFSSREQVKEMLEVDYKEAGIEVKGLCARPGTARGNSREQRFFINQRPITAPEISRAIRNAYEGLTAKGQFASCVLYLTVDPARIDINVHPAKREVRFREPQLISQIVTHAIELALRNLSGQQQKLVAPAFLSPKPNINTPEVKISLLNDTPKPAAQVEPSTIAQSSPVPKSISTQKQKAQPIELGTQTPIAIHTKETKTPAKSDAEPVHSPIKTNPPKATIERPSFSHGLDKLEIISFYQNEYLICRGENGLLIISLKAARERIIFEHMLNNYRNHSDFSQALLIPLSIELTHSDSHLIEKYESQLQDLGLNLRHFGGNSWLLDSTPLNFPEERLVELIKEIVDILHNSPDSLKKDIHLHLAKIISRAASSRAKFNESSSSKILLELDKCETPYSCPQGRPVFINISDSELKKRFGRN